MLLFAFTNTAFSQKTEKNTLTKVNYPQRARNKQPGRLAVLAGGGTAMVVGGLAINWDQPNLLVQAPNPQMGSGYPM
ncbi:MAG: hypothetical protein U0U70_16455 [Chitinophagaceae bacterium]